MLWAALSAFIMSITGTGDDTFEFRKALERLHDAVEERVPDSARKRRAHEALDRVWLAFAKHRRQTGTISRCLERADRTYAVSGADYERCLAGARRAWDAAAVDLVALDRVFRAALTQGEYAAVCRSAQR